MIDNWILWGIEENAFFYSVRNLSKVRSYGLEWIHQINYQWGPFLGQFNYHYNYTKSQNQIKLISPNIDEGEQLLYVPIHSAGYSWTIQNRNRGLRINGNYTGSVNGINEDIPSYILTNFSIFNVFDYQKTSIKIFFNINNITNRQYRVIERRPMPGRSLSLNVQFNFK